MKILRKIFEGYRGEIFLVEVENQVYIMKKNKRLDVDFIAKEYQILKFLDGHYSPKVYEKSKDFFLMDYIKGYNFKESLKLNKKASILLSLKLSYYLDKKRVYHSQLGRYHHMIISKDFQKIWALDFERAKIDSNQKNLLQIVGFYLKDYYPLLKEEIKIYKKDIDLGYKKIVDKILSYIK
ncbi:hypothetical protein [Nitrosophilus kaiyonis]|uniref:hypothetical protein n=1 Tax=Nitrosophilus kaiyonis TaxID=2930200 RepID=UPI00249038CA|nr:hypothetical protein [Nitrosophilus kaiyonis]